ncbi:MAG: chromophore lyase CpcT/CpeT [candidate division Zixibacteria bacterium]|nr:chromophore lyase CpcT/CpeT [candidate division Zixibacteria bacterium]
MKQTVLCILLTIGIMVMFTATGVTKDKPGEVGDFQRLLTWMTGSFSSEEQAKADTNINDIRIEMVPIWKHRSDGYWLYVEQAPAGSLEKPYGQLVYCLTQVNDSILKIALYTLDAPLRFAGDWKKPMPLEKLTADSLTAREGCAIYMKESGDTAFVGNTLGKGCPSSLGGATYVTSEMEITAGGMTIWDRGFDAKDKQVWGATTIGYVFKKQ